MNSPNDTNNRQTRTNNNKTANNKIFFIFNIVIRTVQSLCILFFVLLFLGGSLGIGIGMGYFAYLVKDTTPPTKQELENDISDITEVSQMTYSDGTQIATIKSDLIRTRVNSDQISPLLKKAVIATEDENFDNHHGIVPKALVRALISDITGIGGSSGGSTLTQQLVKQQILTNETTFNRKANEILLAYRVENFFTKDEILTTYLNVSPFGRNNKGENIAGVEEAAKGIFGKNASELTLPQAAFIAGLPQSPIVYSPFTATGELKDEENLSYGLDRKDFVLFSMYREKIITKQEYEEALNYNLVQDFIPQEFANQNTQSYLYTAVLDEASDTLAKSMMVEDGIDPTQDQLDSSILEHYTQQAKQDIQTKGYTIQSTIDKDVYETMQEAVAAYGYILDDGQYNALVETGNILMDNATGKIIGFVGGRNFDQSQVNHAFDTSRQIGSTIKPIAIYGPAIDQGMIGSESRLANYPTTYESEPTELKNATNPGTNTFDTVRTALEWSYNIPVYHLNQAMKKQMGDDNFAYNQYLSKMNYPQSDDWAVESAPLGTAQTTVLTQTNGFQTLANNGVYQQGYMIEKITDRNGQLIYEHEETPVRVYSEATASIMNDLLRSVIDSKITTPFKTVTSTLNPNLGNLDWVGKTGTTDSYVDSWLIVSTPTITLSSWTGYDENMALTSNSGNQNSTYLAYLANSIYSIRPYLFGEGEKFTLADSVIKSTVSSFTGQKVNYFTYNNEIYAPPTTTTTSLYAKDGAPKTEYKFGYGGTDENYAAYWKGNLNKVTRSNSSSSNSSSSSSSDSSSSTKKEEKTDDNTD